MRGPRRPDVQYERIPKYDEWILGVIEEVQLRENHETTFKDETGAPKIVDQVRFRMALEGCKWPKPTRWMTYSYHEKATLYDKYLKHLVENASPDMRFDLDALKGLQVKTMWSMNGEFDNLDQIRPRGAKVAKGASAKPAADEPSEVVGEEPEPEIF